jgi:hypothetical protein
LHANWKMPIVKYWLKINSKKWKLYSRELS